VGAPVFSSKQYRAGFSLARQLTWSPTLQTQVSQTQGAGSSLQTTYAVRDNLSQVVPSLSFAYSPQEDLRFGASMLVTSTNYQGNDSISTLQLTPTSQDNLIHYSQINANAMSLGFSLGGQCDLSDHWKLGLILKFPNLNLWGGSTITFQSITNTGVQTTNSTFFDENATFRYNESFQGNFGVAYVTDTVEFEADVRYTLFSSTQPISTVTSSGGAPTTSSQPLTEITNAFKSVVNFAIGGKYQLSSSVGLHGGFFSSYSPVQTTSGAAFRQIDMNGITVGTSIVIQSFSAALGGAYEWGTSDPFLITNYATANQIESTVSATSLKILYSMTFKF
jgi:hypothetical protein